MVYVWGITPLARGPKLQKILAILRFWLSSQQLGRATTLSSKFERA